MFRNPFRKAPNDGFERWLVSPRGPIRRKEVSPNEVFAQWQAHRTNFHATSLWPVIVPNEYVEGLEQIFADQAERVEDDLAMAQNFDVQRYFSGELEGMFEDEEFEMDLDFDPASLVPAPNLPASQQVATITESKGGLWLALVPCRESWEVPAVLGYGGWNACPMPAEHVAVFREWHSRHRAVPVVMGQDTIELLVEPIRSPAEAKRVATEQYAYCPDIVDQGIGTVQALAESLLGLSVWFFWWD